MQGKVYTVEELMLNDSFLRYCLDNQDSDREFWEREVELHSDQKPIFAEAGHLINLLYGKLDDKEVNRQVEIIKKLVGDRRGKRPSPGKMQESVPPRLGITKKYPNQKSAKHARKIYLIYGTAASVLFFLGIYLFKYASSKPIPLQGGPVGISYTSGMGERKIIQLPDGSVAVLNSNSSITFAGDYNRNERAILLSGEAFFRVAKNPAKPFTVHSGAFFVTALGTSFYVHARDRGKDYKVELLEGKVRLASNENKTPGPDALQTTLLPGEEGAWQSSKMSFTKSICDSMLLKNWVNGQLSFKNMPVEKLFELLQQWYGVHITVKHKKWGKPTLTGNYDNKPLDHVLKIICFSLSTGYSYSGNQVIIE